MTKHWTAHGFARHVMPVPAAIILFALFGVFCSAVAGPVSTVAIKTDQITLHFSDPVARPSRFVLTEPDWIVLNLPNAKPGTRATPSGPILPVLQAHFSNSHIPAALERASPSFVTSGASSTDGRALELAITPALRDGDRNGSHALSGASLLPVSHFAKPPHSRYSVTIALGPPEPGLRPPKVSGRSDRPLIVIDAGHGGHYPGAV